MTQTQYTFTTLRYVHDVVSGEFVNVGVVVHSADSRFVGAKMRHGSGRVKHVFPDLNTRALRSVLRELENSFAHLAKKVNSQLDLAGFANAEAVALSILPRDESALQWSPVGSGVSADLNATVERLYGRFVARYDVKGSARRGDEDVWRPVRDEIASRNIQLKLEEKILVGSADKIAFKHAWKNGRWHAYQPVSLDLANADQILDKARRWRGHLEAVQDGTTEAVDVHFIVGKPTALILQPAYRNALTILAKAPYASELVEENDVSKLVDNIENEFHAHKATTHSN
jgi:hypothetical protein